MRNTKRSIQSSVTIDGVPLIWCLHREQNWTDDLNPVGLAIHVEVVDWCAGALSRISCGKEAAEWLCNAGFDHPAAIVAAKVANHIREAIAAAGPGIEGKPFVYEVAELPS